MTRSFDWMAGPYRWLEYASFGRALERCRFRFLAHLTEVRSALVLGDGDGRFSARLLVTASQARVLAVDNSPAMLQALRRRCQSQDVASRITLCRADLNEGLPTAARANKYDLVVTHFFLDCLSESQIQRLAADILPLLTPGGCWVVSEFRVPDTAMRHVARALVRGLYLAFRLLTGLKTQQLPRYGRVLTGLGFSLQESIPALGGMLVSELWSTERHIAPPAAPGKMEVQ